MTRGGGGSFFFLSTNTTASCGFQAYPMYCVKFHDRQSGIQARRHRQVQAQRREGRQTSRRADYSIVESSMPKSMQGEELLKVGVVIVAAKKGLALLLIVKFVYAVRMSLL